MEQKFSAQRRSGDGYAYASLQGVVDEDSALGSLSASLQAPVVLLDLAGVDRINSYGVRDWVNWLGELATPSRLLLLSRCSPAIVTQANMVTNFTGQALVLSFFAPYYCPNCDRSLQKLLEAEALLAAGEPVTAPAFVCESCGEELEFDDFEESYFAFLQGTGADELRARLDEAMGTRPGLGPRLRALAQGNLEPLSGPLVAAEAPPLKAVEASPPPVIPTPRLSPEQAAATDAFLGLVGSTPPARPVEPTPMSKPSPVAAPESMGRRLFFVLLPYALVALVLVVVAVLVVLVLSFK